MEQHHHVYDTSCVFCCRETDEIFPYYINSSVRKEQDQSHSIGEPYKYNYLLNLMIAPDMNAYLSISNDELYELPLHLQKLIIEAKEEILLEQNNAQSQESNEKVDRQAQTRLEKLKHHFLKNSDGDLFHLMKSLYELIADEGELEDLLRIYQ